jgi:hypothetical protein
MTFNPKVQFEKKESAQRPTDQEIESKVETGKVSNTARAIHQARKRGFVAPAPYARIKPGRAMEAFRLHRRAKAVEISDPTLDRSDETSIAINPRDHRNIVAGAASFDGAQFINTAYVSKDGGHTWTTVTALANTDEGAGIAFDDSGNCYYTTMQGGFFPCCSVSKDGGLTWSAPAAFGFGDKTAVAARGKVALVGFDRVNTEACAFTLDGGATWTVHDFADSGIGTAPLVSYNHKHFYIIYSALDNNLKMFASHDQGKTWTGPTVIVPGNASESTIPGPLSYEGGALTSPGTNVAIDGHGRLHVLYIDSNKQIPMYITSHDHGVTWSKPEDVNPRRAGDAHMWPCLSCTKHGDLLGGSMVYDAALSKYSILRHTKCEDEDEWTTAEADNGPWAAAGPSPNFRIGFGDYFDCDSLPKGRTSVMGWSETVNGAQPWQTWMRVLDICECKEDRVRALEDEIENLTLAFQSEDVPSARDRQFKGRLEELQKQLATARASLKKTHDANALPEEESDERRHEAVA